MCYSLSQMEAELIPKCFLVHHKMEAELFLKCVIVYHKMEVELFLSNISTWILTACLGNHYFSILLLKCFLQPGPSWPIFAWCNYSVLITRNHWICWYCSYYSVHIDYVLLRSIQYCLYADAKAHKYWVNCAAITRMYGAIISQLIHMAVHESVW